MAPLPVGTRASARCTGAAAEAPVGPEDFGPVLACLLESGWAAAIPSPIAYDDLREVLAQKERSGSRIREQYSHVRISGAGRTPAVDRMRHAMSEVGGCVICAGIQLGTQSKWPMVEHVETAILVPSAGLQQSRGVRPAVRMESRLDPRRPAGRAPRPAGAADLKHVIHRLDAGDESIGAVVGDRTGAFVVCTAGADLFGGAGGSLLRSAG